MTKTPTLAALAPVIGTLLAFFSLMVVAYGV